MPTEVLRPNDIFSDTGFNVTGATLLSRISDNSLSTSIEQNQVSAFISCDLEDPSSFDDSDTIINSITISVIGVPGRTGSATTTVRLISSIGTGDETAVAAEDLSFSGGIGTTQTTAAYTAETSLETLSGMGVTVTPGTTGITIFEIFVTVSSDLPPSGKINLSQGKILLKQGKIIL